MGEHDDKVFMRRFGGIIAGLVIVAILLIIIALGNQRTGEGLNPSREAFTEERVSPVGGVRTELPEAAAAQPVSEPAGEIVTEAPDEAVATAETAIDGQAVYMGACAACHMSGAAGAPVPGSDAWAERAGKGLDGLVANAISGLGPIMQPKGGRADLSDEEVRAAVEYMNGQ